MIREELLYKFKKEIDYIMTSVSCPGGWREERARDEMANSIIRSMSRFDYKNIDETPHHKLATVLKDEIIDSYPKFREAIGRKIPSYRKNPKMILKLGGFDWKTRFDVPVRAKRKSKEARAIIKPIASSLFDVDHVFSELRDEAADISRKLDNLLALLTKTREELKMHQHINSKAVILHEIA